MGKVQNFCAGLFGSKEQILAWINLLITLGFRIWDSTGKVIFLVAQEEVANYIKIYTQTQPSTGQLTDGAKTIRMLVASRADSRLYLSNVTVSLNILAALMDVLSAALLVPYVCYIKGFGISKTSLKIVSVTLHIYTVVYFGLSFYLSARFSGLNFDKALLCTIIIYAFQIYKFATLHIVYHYNPNFGNLSESIGNLEEDDTVQMRLSTDKQPQTEVLSSVV